MILPGARGASALAVSFSLGSFNLGSFNLGSFNLGCVRSWALLALRGNQIGRFDLGHGLRGFLLPPPAGLPHRMSWRRPARR